MSSAHNQSPAGVRLRASCKFYILLNILLLFEQKVVELLEAPDFDAECALKLVEHYSSSDDEENNENDPLAVLIDDDDDEIDEYCKFAFVCH